jgi:ABC-2 type transport system permease protein
MQAFATLFRRELASYFLSIIGYVIMAAVMFLTGYSFVVMLVKLQQVPTPMAITEMFYVTPFFWIILLLATPAITMRIFALEKFSGTFETLMTAPIGDLQVVLAKFGAAMFFYMIMWLPLLGCIFVVRHFTSDPAAFDPAVVASTFLGIFLIGGLFVSAGCCASAMTRSQAIAAMISLAFGAGLFMLGVLASQLPSDSASWPTHVLSSLAIFDQMHDFARGVIDTRSVVLFISATLFFLFLNLRILESRRWR